MEEEAWPRLNSRAFVVSAADTNGYHERPAKNRESVPTANRHTGTGLGKKVRRHQAGEDQETGLDIG